MKKPSARVVRIQPPSIPQMHTNGGNKNVKKLPVNHKGEREWSHDLTDCPGDCKTCKFKVVNSMNSILIEKTKKVALHGAAPLWCTAETNPVWTTSTKLESLTPTAV